MHTRRRNMICISSRSLRQAAAHLKTQFALPKVTQPLVTVTPRTCMLRNSRATNTFFFGDLLPHDFSACKAGLLQFLQNSKKRCYLLNTNAEQALKAKLRYSLCKKTNKHSRHNPVLKPNWVEKKLQTIAINPQTFAIIFQPRGKLQFPLKLYLNCISCNST